MKTPMFAVLFALLGTGVALADTSGSCPSCRPPSPLPAAPSGSVEGTDLPTPPVAQWDFHLRVIDGPYSVDFRDCQKHTLAEAAAYQTWLESLGLATFQASQIADDFYKGEIGMGAVPCLTGWPLRPLVAPNVPPPVGTLDVSPATKAEEVRANYYYQGDSGQAVETHEGIARWASVSKEGHPAVRATLIVSSANVEASVTISRNYDPEVAASHLVEIEFTGSLSDSPILQVPEVVLKPTEPARGQPLAGLAVPVDNKHFRIALAEESDQIQRNLQLLAQGSWFDIPILFGDQTRARLTFEKGESGNEVFGEVMSAWERDEPVVSATPPTPHLPSPPPSSGSTPVYRALPNGVTVRVR